MSRPETFHHALLHMQAYLGELAKIAECLDHPEEQERGLELAKQYLTKRVPKQHMEVCYDAAMDHLVNIVEGYEKHEPTQEATS